MNLSSKENGNSIKRKTIPNTNTPTPCSMPIDTKTAVGTNASIANTMPVVLFNENIDLSLSP
jgi:hypothetical protein